MATKDKKSILKDIIKGAGRVAAGMTNVAAGSLGAVPAWVLGGHKASDKVVGLIPKGVSQIGDTVRSAVGGVKGRLKESDRLNKAASAEYNRRMGGPTSDSPYNMGRIMKIRKELVRQKIAENKKK